MISITFDDGYKNLLTYALPILEKYGLKATFYCMSDLEMSFERAERMNREDMFSLAARGHEIGSHTISHPNLFFCSRKRAWKEINGSREALQKMGFAVDTFAYPYGWYGKATERFVQKAGYAGARAFLPSRVSAGRNKFALRSSGVLRATSFSTVKRRIDKAVAQNAWHIITFHEICPEPNFWGTTPELFEKICSYISSKNIPLATVRDGLKSIQ